MNELHEVNLKTFEDKILEVGGIGFIKKHLSEHEILNPKKYYYVVPIYNFKIEDYCEICGKSFKELKNIDPNNEVSWTASSYTKRYICTKCVKPLIPKIRMNSSKNHPQNCACHSCIVAIELGYYKKNNEWIKRPTVICKSADDDCKSCAHSKEHTLSEKGYCNYACDKNRTIGYEDITKSINTYNTI